MATTTGPSTAATSPARDSVSQTAASRRVQRRSAGVSPSNQQMPLSRWVVQARSRPMKVGMALHPSTGGRRVARWRAGGHVADLIEAIAGRRAQRAFDPRAVSAEAQELLWKAVSVAPSHGNVQSARLLVARSAAKRASLVATLSEGNRNWAPAAPLLVALGSLPGHEHADSYGEERALWSFHAGHRRRKPDGAGDGAWPDRAPHGGIRRGRRARRLRGAGRVTRVWSCSPSGSPGSLRRCRRTFSAVNSASNAVSRWIGWLPPISGPSRTTSPPAIPRDPGGTVAS